MSELQKLRERISPEEFIHSKVFLTDGTKVQLSSLTEDEAKDLNIILDAVDRGDVEEINLDALVASSTIH